MAARSGIGDTPGSPRGRGGDTTSPTIYETRGGSLSRFCLPRIARRDIYIYISLFHPLLPLVFPAPIRRSLIKSISRFVVRAPWRLFTPRRVDLPSRKFILPPGGMEEGAGGGGKIGVINSSCARPRLLSSPLRVHRRVGPPPASARRDHGDTRTSNLRVRPRLYRVLPNNQLMRASLAIGHRSILKRGRARARIYSRAVETTRCIIQRARGRWGCVCGEEQEQRGSVSRPLPFPPHPSVLSSLTRAGRAPRR